MTIIISIARYKNLAIEYFSKNAFLVLKQAEKRSKFFKKFISELLCLTEMTLPFYGHSNYSSGRARGAISIRKIAKNWLSKRSESIF